MKIIKIVTSVILVVLIMMLGYRLRLTNYSTVPFPGESTDEYSNSWVGLSLIRLGMPMGISGVEGYKDTRLRYINVDRIFQKTAPYGPLTISGPWFDHPPMMGLITGGYAYAKGARVFEDTVTSTVRKPMVLLGTFTIGAVMLLAWQILGHLGSIVAGIIYATSPLLIVNSRMIQAENGYLPILLLAICSLFAYEKYKKNYFLWLAGILSALCITFKVPGLVTTLIGVMILLTQQEERWPSRLKSCFVFVSISLCGLWLFAVYGLALNWDIFKLITAGNAGRFYGIGFHAAFDLITSSKITITKYITDGWPLLGWLCLWTIAGDKQNFKTFRYLVLPVACYLVVYLLMGSMSFGWYRIPFLPFLYIGIAYLFVGAIENRNKVLMVLMGLLIPIGVNLQKITEGVINVQQTSCWRYGIVTVVLIALSSLAFKNKLHAHWNKVLLTITVAVFALAIASSLGYANMITPEYWYRSN
jgi:4-amino-4-deoxy-L-arabinose transferase-like glycosyltransferase